MNLVDSDNFIVEKGNTIHLSTVQVQANLITAVFFLCTFSYNFLQHPSVYMQLLFFYSEIN